MHQRVKQAFRPARSRLTAGTAAAGAWAILALLPGCTGVAAPVAGPAPVSYASPPPAAYSSPAYPPAVAYGATCYAGAYTCRMPASGPIGTSCSCPGLGAPSFGTIR
jgi:hypothetical protein